MANQVFFPTVRAALSAGFLVATLALATSAHAQVTGSATPGTDAQGQAQETVTIAAPLQKNKKEKVVQSKDTRKAIRKDKKVVADSLIGVDAKLPDKQLYDKAEIAVKKGRFDIARLDLQTLLNTYPDSEYQMRAKLAIADSWYREGGSAALTQAESEYKDFITFFPNAPEAAEAQMRVGDIYFRQMDKPDRDYARAVHAEEEYRTMLQQFPDSKLVPQAKQRLREVQEVLATRESDIATFYASHENWTATIARYQTVADTYPLYSHMDDVLVSLGDAWEAEARYVRTIKVCPAPGSCLPEAARSRLEQVYDDRAADAYRKVILEHSAAAHVEDARDRLEAMNRPVPTPTPEQLAASSAMENSRGQYTLLGRARLLILHTPDVVATATEGDAPLVDPSPMLAPKVRKQIEGDFSNALNPTAVPAAAVAPAPGTTSSTTAAVPSAPAAPLAFSDVPAADGSIPSGGTTTVMTNTTGGTSSSPSVGAEIVHSSTPLGSVNDVPRSSVDAMPAVGPTNNTPLPAIEKPGAAPDAVNDLDGKNAPVAGTPNANGKNPKPEFDKADESSSKHKKKKGIKKLDPLPQ